ncbi:hypothetical protein HHI36_016047 [Cryptolaemus montrouzieri]|uniref:Exocyst complex component 7 n=1 Tax=Cryptolaemus montrouzieri TaxID=559131 RepID=A0ABD2N7I0_9CUCU
MDFKVELYEVENKLKKESNNLDLLKERLEKKSQTNIDATIHLLDNVISYYDVSTDVEGVIEKGPGEGALELEPYLQSLNRLAAAQKYFEEHIPQSVERENVTTLFEKGGDKINSEFKSILDKYNTPMLPVVLSDLIHVDENNKSPKIPPPQIPDNIKAKLIQMSNWLLDHQKYDHLTVYGSIRGYVLQRSLTMLRNHQKSVSGGSAHGVSSSPMTRPKFQSRHETSRRPSTRRLQAFQGKANKMFLKASQTIEHSTGFNLSGRRASSHLESPYSGEEVDNEQEMENYLLCIIALHKLMQIEKTLMKQIIPITHQPRVFELIVRDAMDTIVQDGESIVQRAKKCIGKHDFGTVLVIFPILKQLRSLRPEFEKTVYDCDLNVKAKFDSILSMLHSTGSKCLEDFIESLKSDSVTQLPSDGTVHELTCNVITFLEQLLDYIDTIGIILANDPGYAQQLVKMNVSDQNKALLGLYIKKVLVQLNHTLIKAKCEEYYYNSIQEQKKAYLQSWNKLLQYIWGDDAPVNLLHGDRLRDKDRNIIKEKFAVQRGYSIPDVQLRESIKRDNKELIIPKYNAFYNRYASVQFTKNIDKYIKHKPDEVSSIIDRFFDVAA